MLAVFKLDSSLRNRLVLGIGVMLLPLAVAMGVSFFSSQAMLEVTEEVVRTELGELHPATALMQAMLRASMPPNDYLISGDPAEREDFRRLAADVDRRLLAIGDAGEFHEEEEVRLLAVIGKEWAVARAEAEALLAQRLPAADPSATARMKAFDARLQRATDAIAALHDTVAVELAAKEGRARELRRTEGLVLGVTFALAFLLALGSGLAIARSIVRPVEALKDGVDRLREGDHSHRLEVRGPAEIGQVASALNQVADRLLHDALTGTLNRGELARRLPRELDGAEQSGRPLALLMVDVDHFKRINDTFGHPGGDEVLKEVASRLLHGLRDRDFVARFGGEEFAVVLADASPEGAHGVAERIRTRIAGSPISVAGAGAVEVTVSVGMATFPADGREASVLLEAADRALYTAKRSGRNRTIRASESPPARVG